MQWRNRKSRGEGGGRPWDRPGSPLPFRSEAGASSHRLSFLVLLLVAALALLPLTACQAAEQERFSGQFLSLFDTVTQVVGYAEDQAAFQAYMEQLYDELEVYHQLYDIYQDYPGVTNIKSINDAAGLAPVTVDEKIIDLLLFAREAYDLSGGRLNMAMGSVLSIWHDYRTAGIDDPLQARLPPRDLLEEAVRHTSIEAVVIDEEASTVYLADPAMSLDVGALAKGFATQRVGAFIVDQGLTDVLLSVGGNVRAFGEKAGGQLWQVGIKDPFSDGDLTVVNLSDRAVVTSGDYIRAYTVDGRRYHHLIDPDTLFPANFFAAVTVICPDSGLADALSTSLFLMPYEEGRALVDALEEVEALWVFHDGSTAGTLSLDPASK